MISHDLAGSLDGMSSFDTLAPPPAAGHRQHRVRAFLVSFKRLVFRNHLRDMQAIEDYLRKPHGHFHVCLRCRDRSGS